MPADWTRVEVEAVVADYFDMWFAERAGRDYNKTEHRRALKPVLQNRNDGSIERKHQNISAILVELGVPPIDGYKPLGNYQRLLSEVVADRVQSDAKIGVVLLRDLAQSVVPPDETSRVLSLVDLPIPRARRARVYETQVPTAGLKGVNYLELEARKNDLGRAGEKLVITFEQNWLISRGQKKLAEKVEHVSVTQGDGLGFDVLSFDPDGRERLLEVKTTRYGRYTPFFATRRELEVSDRRREQYHLCRVFNFSSQPQFFRASGYLKDGFDMDPTQYIARIA